MGVQRSLTNAVWDESAQFIFCAEQNCEPTQSYIRKKDCAALVWKFEKPSKHRLQLKALKLELLSISHDPYQQIPVIKCANKNMFLV